MEEKTLKTLEFDKIREMLAEEAIYEDAKKMAKALMPETDIKKVEKLLLDTDRALVSLFKFGPAPVLRVSSVEASLKRATIGGSLSMAELPISFGYA